jgi:hypothetical protein
VVEKGPPGGGQFDAVHAAAYKLDADLVFEIADLTTEGKLGRVQLFLSREQLKAERPQRGGPQPIETGGARWGLGAFAATTEAARVSVPSADP